MRVAAQAFHFEVAKPGVDRVAHGGRWLRRSLKCLFHASQASGRLPCVLPLPALPLPGLSAIDSVARLVPMRERIAGPHGTGKPLQHAVDSVTAQRKGNAP
jgi:hypothetical protein